MDSLDRHLPQFDVNEIHQISLDISPEEAVDRVLGLPVTPDWIVRSLFRIRGLGGLDLSVEDFASRELGLEIVERTSSVVVAVGRPRRQRIAISFEAAPREGGGSILSTETRVADVGPGFRLYWLVVGPFSALIRRHWLRAVSRRSG